MHLIDTLVIHDRNEQMNVHRQSLTIRHDSTPSGQGFPFKHCIRLYFFNFITIIVVKSMFHTKSSSSILMVIITIEYVSNPIFMKGTIKTTSIKILTLTTGLFCIPIIDIKFIEMSKFMKSLLFSTVVVVHDELKYNT